jgi:hypothetical protein
MAGGEGSSVGVLSCVNYTFVWCVVNCVMWLKVNTVGCVICESGKQLEDNSQGELDRHAEEGSVGRCVHTYVHRYVRAYVRGKQGAGYSRVCVFV